MFQIVFKFLCFVGNSIGTTQIYSNLAYVPEEQKDLRNALRDLTKNATIFSQKTSQNAKKSKISMIQRIPYGRSVAFAIWQILDDGRNWRGIRIHRAPDPYRQCRAVRKCDARVTFFFYRVRELSNDHCVHISSVSLIACCAHTGLLF